ncbi:PRTRC system protein F [Ralstonia nicotianae]|uniref:PRTRC system protein F n=1 Tax=Ralstonia pseudosolanacearum TaxID=1310165 RepID=UPI002005FB36|nr:PRTRC system protein F [Ralstonia pseudosolanacearum]MCK4118361.1 PRTRC system protein F [Ralstonia pseudosolanacearum]
MLFDSRECNAGVVDESSTWTPSRRHTVTGCRPAHDFLTLPTVGAAIPCRALVSHRDEVDVVSVVRAHFEAGPLQARDVRNAASAGDAFAEALFAWLRRRTPQCRRLCFSFALMDASAARDQVDQFGWEGNIVAPLYLAIELPREDLYEIGPQMERMRRAHPSLLCTVLSLVNEASGKTLHLRTPDALLDMFARWWWDWDATVSDEDARDSLRERFGSDNEDIERYLPSIVKPALAPAELFPEFRRGSRSRRPGRRVLSKRQLEQLACVSGPWIRRVCRSLLELQAAIDKARNSHLFEHAQWSEPVYLAATIAVWQDAWTIELLDDHFNCMSSSGEGTMYQALIPLASDPAEIIKQYRDLMNALDIIKALDRVLTLISR